MEKIIYEVLDKIEKNGFLAYLVGGYPRDTYLQKECHDYDICTSATPEELKKLFEEVIEENFGSLKIKYQDKILEITTFRIEKDYKEVRSPNISYTKSLKEDLNRRDFIMNTLCMDKEENYIDLMGAKADIDQKIIRVVGDANKKLKEDPLRILRAIRFAATLDFTIDKALEKAILKNKEEVKRLSFYRKKEELDRILSKEKGLDLLKKYELDEALNCSFKDCSYVDDVLGMWAQICPSPEYPFTKEEKKKIEMIRFFLLKGRIDDLDLYYGNQELIKIFCKIKKKDIHELERKYEQIPIHDSSEIDIKIDRIIELTSEYPSIVFTQIENQIIAGTLKNNQAEIEKFILKNFKKK